MVYRSPAAERVFSVIKTVFVSFLLISVAAGFAGALLLPTVQKGSAAWVLAPLGLVVLAIPFLVVYLANRGEPTRLSMFDDRLEIGGRLFRRRFTYDELHMVKLETPDNKIGKSVKLLIEPKPGKSIGMWLKADEAQECFDALRSMSPHIPAIGLGQSLHAPVDPRFADRGRQILAQEFRRRAQRALMGGIASCVVGCLIIGGLIFGGPAVRQRPRSWMMAAVFPIAGAGAIVTSFGLRRKSRELNAGGFPGTNDDDAFEINA